ncbi:MAG: hypothetical protein QNJ47_11170 [Nostocaceae cyanobacterium]|nr:hypothetical protein [Nostocaceae cyanobacterium]
MLLRKDLTHLSAVGMALLLSVLASGAQVKAQENLFSQNYTNKATVEYTVAQDTKPIYLKTLLDKLRKQSVIYRALAQRWERERRLTYRTCVRSASPSHCEKIIWKPNPYRKRILLTNKQIWMIEQRYDYY